MIVAFTLFLPFPSKKMSPLSIAVVLNFPWAAFLFEAAAVLTKIAS